MLDFCFGLVYHYLDLFILKTKLILQYFFRIVATFFCIVVYSVAEQLLVLEVLVFSSQVIEFCRSYLFGIAFLPLFDVYVRLLESFLAFLASQVVELGATGCVDEDQADTGGDDVVLVRDMTRLDAVRSLDFPGRVERALHVVSEHVG